MKKILLTALGFAMFSTSVFAQPATTAKSFRMYNDPTSSVTITASIAPAGNGTFFWPQPAAGIFKSTAGGIMSIGSIGLNSGDVSGILPIANGGTGLGTLGLAGQVLTVNGAGTALIYTTPTTGTVTSFSSGNLSPLFTTNVTNPTTTPALSFTLSNAGAYTILGNNTNASAAPTYFTPVLASALFQNQGTTNTVLHGNAAGNPSWGAVSLTADVSGTLPILNGGTNATTIGADGAVAYSNGTSYNFTTVGSNNQILKSNGGGAPTWVNANSVVTGSALTKTDDANVTLTLGGTPATALLQSVSITAGWNGQLSITRGGTNGTAAPVNGGVAYGNAGAYAFSAAGTSGQFLQSTGASAPTWVTGSVASAKGSVVGTGTYTYTVNPGIGSLAGRQIMISFESAGVGGLQTTYSVYTTGAPANSFVVEFANNITASEKFHWVVF